MGLGWSKLEGYSGCSGCVGWEWDVVSGGWVVLVVEEVYFIVEEDLIWVI